MNPGMNAVTAMTYAPLQQSAPGPAAPSPAITSVPVPSAAPVTVREPATLVALLVWTYQRQKADVMSGKGLHDSGVKAPDPDAEPPHAWSGCGIAQLEAVALLGVRIEGGGPQRATLHNDAELINDLVVELSRTDWIGAMLLRRHGREGAPPEWSDGRQEFEPVRDERDRIVQDAADEAVTVTDITGRTRTIPVRYCPVRLYPAESWIAMTRGEYRAWHGALAALGRMLATPPAGRALTRFVVTGLGAAAEPWTAPPNEIR